MFQICAAKYFRLPWKASLAVTRQQSILHKQCMTCQSELNAFSACSHFYVLNTIALLEQYLICLCTS